MSAMLKWITMKSSMSIPNSGNPPISMNSIKTSIANKSPLMKTTIRNRVFRRTVTRHRLIAMPNGVFSS